ncbi:MAG: bifunctional nicotinamidase/pyrazinamidase [Cyclobacteriaceae bacterium]|jgi:nicotinamidase/pyrazinamidase|nr:bifunctional nicotinamidase/pyrazinamidase [Cyclobacteriaceae bacterium]
MKALILVDIQYDFTTGGNLEVKQGEEIIPLVNTLQKQFELVVATQDWHPPNHLSFASNHPGRKPFETITLNGLEQVLWPDHCVQGTSGANFHEALDMKRVAAIFRKGMDPAIDSYSGFYDNGRLRNTGLAGYLRDRNVAEIFVVGLAGDYCVYFTARDALLEGFKCTIIADATRPISEDGFRNAKEDLKRHGGVIAESRDLLP